MKRLFRTAVTLMAAAYCLAGCVKAVEAEAKTEAISVESEVERKAFQEDGQYFAEVILEGGSGKTSLISPAKITVKDGVATALIEWSSPNYDYMIVDGEKYLQINTDGNSVFEIPVAEMDVELPVIANTTAMSSPHEIDYTITFHSESANKLAGTDGVISESVSESSDAKNIAAGTEDAVDWLDLEYIDSMELQYAENFEVDYYEDGYTLLSIKDGTKILVVPEGKEIPKDLDEDIIPLKQPVRNLYLVASAVMDMFCELDSVDSIRLSGQKTNSWHIEEARTAMETGKIVYAGKYSKPDYELILAEDCSLAIENMMISHSPEVIEKLESFGIPVMIEQSSYENHPLGRVEWIRFFGALLGKEELAEERYSEQIEILKRVAAEDKTDKTVAFFFITSGGLVQVRRPSDYVPKMIELAGGNYIFESLGEEDSARSTVNIQMEEFYLAAKDADFLIYNSSIDGGVQTLEELLDKSSLLADFKAVKEGKVWCTTNDMYQQSMSIGYLIEDMHRMILDENGNEADMKYLFRVK